MLYPRNEHVEEIITGEYRDSDMRVISGVYETKDDNFYLVSDRVFDRLVNRGIYGEIPSVEEAEEMYGGEIIRRYFERQKEESEKRRMENLLRGIEVHKETAEIRRMQIIAMVINGYSKPEIEMYYNISRSTVDKALRGINGTYVWNIYHRHKEIFENVSVKRVKEFVEANCNYKAYRLYSHRADNA